MNKQELIEKLVVNMRQDCKSTSSFDNGFNAGLIKALKLVYQLDEDPKVIYSVGQIIEQEARKVLRNFNSFTSVELDEFIECITSKNLLAAIKLYKTCSGMGLKEAKDDVDLLRSNLATKVKL